MKKKILSFILAIFLILPCIFALSACNNGDDEPKTLAGKTVSCSGFYDDFNFNNGLYLSYDEGPEGKYYNKYVTYSELLEMTLGTDAFSYQNNEAPTTLVEAKELFEQKLKDMFCTASVNPYIQFSNDLTYANIFYSAEDLANGNSSGLYDVECVDTHSGQYILKANGEEIVRLCALNSDHKEFTISYQGNPNLSTRFITEWLDFNLDGDCETQVTLTATDGSGDTIQKRLDEVFGAEQTISVVLLYSVMK